MGNATSSALRADDPATGGDGPAFGSLASMGAPRKLKKKPVLVLDPEELAAAHMLFQDASAELLGEEVDRSARPAPVLGLAPMDLDGPPEGLQDTGEDDEIEEDDLPPVRDLLRVSDARPALDEEDEEALAAHLEKLDIDQRIFPDLPLQFEDDIAAQDEAEPQTENRAHDDGLAEDVEDVSTVSAEDAQPPRHTGIFDTDEAISFAENTLRSLSEPQVPGRDAQRAVSHAFPINPLPEPEPELEEAVSQAAAPEPSDMPAPAPVFGDAPFLDFPAGPLAFAFESEVPLEDEVGPTDDFPAEDTVHGAEEPISEPCHDHYAEAVPEELREPQPADPQVHDEDTTRFEWAMVEDDGEEHSSRQGDYLPEPAPEQPDESGAASTFVEDEPVDGYAFMYAGNNRGRTLNAVAEGESNSLRARLIREREREQAEQDASASRTSLWGSFTAWLRSMFG